MTRTIPCLFSATHGKKVTLCLCVSVVKEFDQRFLRNLRLRDNDFDQRFLRNLRLRNNDSDQRFLRNLRLRDNDFDQRFLRNLRLTKKDPCLALN